MEEGHAIGNPVANKKISDARYSKVTDDFGQRIDLILLPHRTHFQERKAGMHGQNHDRTHQKKHCISAMHQCFHCAVQVFHSLSLF